ncbi:hypothetical protein BNJ_00128 [Kaumoebavirus]|nr:hypothetical protein BNJ_00128 [Kaumoebavirus]ARA71961.1 hypothetical protein BNJ_00128 [Kaumoebavirus]
MVKSLDISVAPFFRKIVQRVVACHKKLILYYSQNNRH